jgi:hypothetical protein
MIAATTATDWEAKARELLRNPQFFRELVLSSRRMASYARDGTLSGST